MMNDATREFLAGWWLKFRALPRYEQEYYWRNWGRHKSGWESYDAYNGYGLAAVYWYEQQFRRMATPKVIMHELRKAMKTAEVS